MALDDAMRSRLDGITRSYQALTERLADPDVIGDSNLLRQVMKDRSQSEEVVMAYEEYKRLDEELVGATELFQDAGDDAEMREMARAEMKDVEAQLEELQAKITILLLPKDPNDDRNCMLEIRAGTGGGEANIFAGEFCRSSYNYDGDPDCCAISSDCTGCLYVAPSIKRGSVRSISQIHV